MTLSKILEKIIYKRVYNYLDKNNILYESQYGFCNKRSCEQAITELLGHILQAKESYHLSASIFLDLSKAFNTLNHDVLFKKLDRYGIKGITNGWFKSYLSNLRSKSKNQDQCILQSDGLLREIQYHLRNGTRLVPWLFIICTILQ